ncbi:MAG: DNA-directed RNA polymerase subunit alpha [Candidatus Magasanikbacteria bacterium]|nr:DNA-directed RNA polymerase subunit alpha [Candidatus Magasanikbacteria bacterium]
MEKFLLPSIFKVEEGEKIDVATIVIEPCYHGYGTTLGNALRRILLSSLPGAAVTAVKIKGATHEFTALDYVQEDVVEIILNLKKLRLRIFTPEEVKLTLKAEGEGEVTAAQIETTSDVEIVNSDLHLATLTHKNAKLEMEIFVSQGRGYVSVEEKNEKKMELGTIAVDSIFNSVLNVGYKVDFVRVGEITNFERLSLTIETDGTITPVDALLQGAKILLDHLNLILDGFGGGEENKEAPLLDGQEEKEGKKEAVEEVEEKKAEEGKKQAKRGRKKGTTAKKKK